MKSKRQQKGVLKGRVKMKKIMEREEFIEPEVFCKSNLVQLSSQPDNPEGPNESVKIKQL